VRREVAARRLICWRLCGCSACTTGGSTTRCWRNPWPPTHCGGRALWREQGRAGGPRTTTTTKVAASGSPLPLPRPHPHLPLQSRRPAERRPPPSPIPPLTEHPVRFPYPTLELESDVLRPLLLFPSITELERTHGPLPARSWSASTAANFIHEYFSHAMEIKMALLSLQVLSPSHIFTF